MADEMMMRAVRLHAIGGPEELRVDEVAVPRPSSGEALVRIHAAAFNRRDIFVTQGLYPRIRLPVTLGSDGAGVVAALGESRARCAVGDEVVIDPMLDWGHDMRVWDARNSGILGMPTDGTFADYVLVPSANLYPKPKPLSMEEAAAIPLAGLTAYRATFTRGTVVAGETVLITGIGGGVQTFVLLFAKHAGARTIVTSSSDEKLARAQALGADLTVNYVAQPDWAKRLKDERVDVVIDSSGGATLAQAIDVVRNGGRIVIYGGTNGDAAIKMFPIFWKHISILGTSMGSPSDFVAMLELFNGGLRPVLDERFAIRDAVAAAERLSSSRQFGKVILRVEPL